MQTSGDDFYGRLPVFTGFADIMDPARYRPVPDGWAIGLADVVNSTQAIAAGRYKAVNTAGAAVIAAVMNALGRRDFPFAFGGDGATFAIGPDGEAAARDALARTAAWARDDLDLTLRVAMVPVATIRDADHDVVVARFAPSRNLSYAMFMGGGTSWAEQAMKRGLFAIEPGPAGARPDLSGLSCRWQEIPASKGVILSVIVAPAGSGDGRFRALIEDLLAAIEDSRDVVRPMPEAGPTLAWPATGLDLEARASRRPGESLRVRRAALLVRSLAAYLIFRFRIRLGRFDPAVYRRDLVENSDFRKYDDGLQMTLDCTPDFADGLERRLERAEVDGIARFGLHRQSAALVTCITPSVYAHDHVHFVDGAAGGYASAAARIKAGAAAVP